MLLINNLFYWSPLQPFFGFSCNTHQKINKFKQYYLYPAKSHGISPDNLSQQVG